MDPTNISTDKELLLRIAVGDENAFTIIFDRFKDDLYSLAWSFTRSHAIASDLLQEIFLKIWLQRTELPSIENLHGYIVVLARNVIFDELRRQDRIHRNKQDYLSDMKLPFDSGNVIDYLQNKQYRDAIEKGKAHLSDQQSAVFDLIKLKGYSREETASALKIAPETVKKHLERAMRTIKAFLIAHYHNTLLFLLFFIKK